MKYSGDLQTPWESSSLVGDFYFIEEVTTSTSTQTTLQTLSDDKPKEDIWENATDYLFSNESTVNIKWKASNNRFTALMNEKDITAQTVNAGCGDDLLVYHNNTKKYFLFDNFWQNQDNIYREALSLPFDVTTCWRSIDNTYWFFDKGRDITANTTIAFFDEHKLIYDKQNNQYYFCAFFTQFMDGNVYPAEPLFSLNGSLWRYNGQFYFLYVNGEQIGSRTFSQWSGNDLIVYDEEGFSSYLLPDLYNRKGNQLRPAEIIATPGMITWSRQDNTYYLYRNGVQFAGTETTVADYAANDLIVFEKTYQQTYLLKDWAQSNDHLLRNAIILFSPTGVFWRRSGNNYWVYRHGQLINYELTWNWNGNDLELYDSYLGLTYILPDYAFSDDNILRAAKLK